MNPPGVRDDEQLYRCVREDYVETDADNNVIFSKNAFNDSKRRPSVDRAEINGYDPEQTRVHPSDGIAFLITQRVRAINSIVERTSTGRLVRAYEIDVTPDPIKDHPTLRDNPAHAEIHADRPMNGSAFERLKLVLADMAQPAVLPNEPIVYLTRSGVIYHRRECHHLHASRIPQRFSEASVRYSPCSACRPNVDLRG